MKSPKPEEIIAMECVKAALPDVEVRLHDDNSLAAMYDLELRRDGSLFGAMEVTSSTDREALELWKLVNTRPPWRDSTLTSSWFIGLAPTARVKTLRSQLVGFLGQLERSGYRQVSRSEWFHPARPGMELLGLTSVHRLEGSDRPGSMYFTVDRAPEMTGGFMAADGDALASWIGPWIAAPAQADNLAKLAASGAEERHLFIWLPGFTEAPFAVTDIVMRHEPPPINEVPQLPAEVTHVWVSSGWATPYGLRWSPDNGWTSFEKPPSTVAPDAPAN